MKIVSIIFIFLSLFLGGILFKNFCQNNGILGGDVLGYYSYLPSTFIYENVTHMDSSGNDLVVHPHLVHYLQNPPYNNPKTPKGKHIVQYTMGLAYLEFPFFMAAHLYSKIFHHKADGFDLMYSNAIKFGNFIYAILGIFFTYLVLCRYYSRSISILTISLILIGSNLFYFTFIQAGMAHIPIFFLTSLLLYFTPIYYTSFNKKHLFIIGLTIGLITIIRTIDGLIGLMFIMYQIHSLTDFKARILHFVGNKTNLIIGLLAFSLPILPQFIYWKITTGQFFYYSYGSQTIDLTHPHVIEGLFGGGNGWLLYSPMMVFSVLGLIIYRKDRNYGWVTCLLFFIYIFVIYSWFCYQYINGFGSRPMIDIYPILALPFAACLTWVFSLRRRYIYPFCFVLCFMIYYNLALTYKQITGQLWSECSRPTFIFSTLFKSHLEKKDLITNEIPYFQPLHPELFHTQRIAQNQFDTSFLHLQNSEHSPVLVSYMIKNDEMTNHQYLKISGRFRLITTSYNYYSFVTFGFQVRRKGQIIYRVASNIDNKLGEMPKGNSATIFDIQLNTWDELSYYLPLPLYKHLNPGDILELSIWNPAKSEIDVDDVSLSFLKNKAN